MKFTKMHGLGNDYVYVDGTREPVPDPSRTACVVADRHRGVGGDGLIIIRPPSRPGAVCRMEMYNADGSRAQMCGNGIRCVAKYVLDRSWTPGPALQIETESGLRDLRLVERDSGGRASLIEVDMGPPRLARKEIPLADGGPPEKTAVGFIIEAGGRRLEATAVSMGNPHCIVRLRGVEPFGTRLADLVLSELGPPLERHRYFPERANVEFVEPRSGSEMDFRVWERGSGETKACGTGACAAVVAGVLGGWCDRSAVVHLPGGDLSIRWDDCTNRVFMTGPAVEVFEGELDLDRLLAN